ncbi:thiamine pyrophosphate-binding protein [Microbacterium sp. CPCC 204701]|uniref:thiamine pyrophosphate-binding protein n=1 Tax=Microbacterium sp. CPCC 204701 TaxID=2493084 RepID=UPI0013E372EC|nr:thiamine pyrophosphate-binding protein [Microbacterium sp. CPCC 204701]
MKAYIAIAQALLDAGITEMFGLMGDANMLYAASYKEAGGVFVDALHEGASVSMADGYARVTGTVGVASVTHGPGITNALTAFTEAVRARTPLVLLCGDTPSRIPEHGQAFDLAAVATAAGAEYVRSTRAQFVLRDLRRAIRRTARTRRPILLNVPVDYLLEDVELTPTPRPIVEERLPLSDLESDAVDGALGLLVSADRPLVLAGRGVALAGAEESVVTLAGLLGAPLATTLLGRGLFAGHPHNVGLFGGLGTPVGERAIAAADCILVLGASLSRHTTEAGALLEGKTVIYCDADAANLARTDEATVAIQADVKGFVDLLIEALEAADARRPTSAVTEIAGEIEAFRPLAGLADQEQPGVVDMRSAVRALNEILPRDRYVVTDCGRFQRPVFRHLEVLEPLTFTHAVHFGSIGLGLATGIGASVADTSRTTVVIAGDGGAMQSLLELHTAVQRGLPLIIAVLNDSSYGAEYEKLGDYGQDPTHALYTWPDLAVLAEALGATGRTVRALADFEAVAGDIEAGRTPLLVDIVCDATADIKAY